jgi:cytochrome c biogenesis protein CcmG/thiol:disulfide interchange protein DsbE
LGFLGYAVTGGPAQPPQIGSPVPDFQLVALDGTPFRLSDQLGKVVVVNFFASWCNPCWQEAPELRQAWDDYQDQGVQFIGIAYKDTASKAQAFLDEVQITYPNAADPANRIARAYGVTGVPETFVIDRQGRLVRHFLGPVSSAELGQEIERALEP